MILEHILSYPGTYEIPLRHMYSINCAQAPRSANQSPTFPPTPGSTSPTDPQFSSAVDMVAASTQFTTALLAHISQLPSQPASLPPSFITMFVKKCFVPEIHWVDFSQALTALDYLKDLETRRRKEVAELKSRLGINPDSATADTEAMNAAYPAAAECLHDVDTKDKRADSLYTQLYIALRRWVRSSESFLSNIVAHKEQILINEMSLMPFNKHNCVAMLNTLYPPVVTVSPTAKLKPDVLGKQRDGFFRYIKAVESKGTGVLMNLQKQNAEPDEENGWPSVHRSLLKYLRLSSSMIAECQDISNVSHFQANAPTAPLPQIPQHAAPRSMSSGEKGLRKADSGIDFDRRPQSKASGEDLSRVSSARKASTAGFEHTKPPATPKRSAMSTLERIAKEFLSIRRSKPEIEEIIPDPPRTPSKSKEPKESKTPKSLRKMRSFGALSELKHSNASSSTVSSRLGSKRSLLFDKETMRGERLAYEERTGINRSKLGYERGVRQ